MREPQSVLTALCLLLLAVSFVPGAEVAAYGSVALGSVFALQRTFQSLKERSIDVNLLMVLAAIGAVAVGQVREAAGLLFLFSLSTTLEHLAMSRTKDAIGALMKLRPVVATLVDGTEEREVPVASLVPGDQIRILPFQGVPADGVILEGTTSVDEAVMTGESMAVTRGPGDKVLSGSQNLEGMILARVTAKVGETALDRVVDLVKEAQEHRASGERISRWFGQRYTVFVLVVFVLAVLWRAAQGASFADGLAQSLPLLVALSPCALVISTPASTLSALTWAARNGILIRGGEFIEQAGLVDTLAFDKTGTLTQGRPAVREICTCDSGGDCDEVTGCWSSGGTPSKRAFELLSLAASAEKQAGHPIAEAIVRKAQEWGIEISDPDSTTVYPGMGVEATVLGVPVRIGRRAFFQDLPPPFLEQLERMQSESMTVAVLHAGDRYAALGLIDLPRVEANRVLRSVDQLGLSRVWMLTGDHSGTAQAIARQLEITEVRAGLTPEEKRRVIKELTDEGRKVMMVGDGVNDAPSLSLATVGVAMGGRASDIALNSADVVLMRDRLDCIPEIIRLGRRTNRVILANLVFAVGVVLTLTISSFVTELPLPLAVLGHEGSTVLVILNGLRLLSGPDRPQIPESVPAAVQAGQSLEKTL